MLEILITAFGLAAMGVGMYLGWEIRRLYDIHRRP